jgi:uncharacterized ferritin-like protein (DUF455 family)
MAGPRTLRAACLDILREPDVEAKAALAVALAAQWRGGTLAADVPLEELAADGPPDEPARPAAVRTVELGKTKGSKSLKSAFHAMVHAESYAIDLAADLVARFAWVPPAAADGGEPAAAAAAAAESSSPPAHPAAAAATAATPYERHPWAVPGGTLPPLAWFAAEDGDAAAAAAGCAPRLPRRFLDDWVTVAEEEGLHLQRWLGRLRAAGGRYGDFPVHGSLWESAERTSYSLPARLAVVHCVHEARGLDTAPGFRARLEGAGDTESAGVLAANVAQEVVHVARGRAWLQWLADAGGRGAAAPALYVALVRRHFHGVLRPPFDEAARDAAGLTREWWGPLTVKPEGGPGGGGGGGGEGSDGERERAPEPPGASSGAGAAGSE